MTSDDLSHKYLRGVPVRNRILDEVKEQIDALNAKSPVGTLVSIMIGDVEEVAVYIRGQKTAADRAGIPFREEHWQGDISAKEAKARLVAMNDDPSIIGVILQRPIPAHLNIRSLQGAIHPLKDVEGMNPASIGNIIYNDVALAPCTAAASVELLKEARGDLKGMEVVMIGHSEIVGKPAASLLMAEGATVTVCHHMTRSVAMHSRRAEAILVAVGKPKLVTADMVMPGAVVIDIGINYIPDTDTTGKGRIVGDADTDEVAKVAGWITPVPGGVGPVTTAMLMRNALNAVNKQRALGWV